MKSFKNYISEIVGGPEMDPANPDFQGQTPPNGPKPQLDNAALAGIKTKLQAVMDELDQLMQ